MDKNTLEHSMLSFFSFKKIEILRRKIEEQKGSKLLREQCLFQKLGQIYGCTYVIFRICNSYLHLPF